MRESSRANPFIYRLYLNGVPIEDISEITGNSVRHIHNVIKYREQAMGMNNTEQKPNYEFMLKAAIASAQSTMEELKNVVNERNSMFWINSEGNYCVYDGIDVKNAEIEMLENKILDLNERINELTSIIQEEKNGGN